MYKNGDKEYDMKIDKIKKTFILSAQGFFKVEDGNSFLNDYNRLVKTFPTTNYSLIIDVSELKASSPEVAAILHQVVVRYMEVPFKRRFLVTQGSPVTLSQFKRLGKGVKGFNESVEYVNDQKEALQKLMLPQKIKKYF